MDNEKKSNEGSAFDGFDIEAIEQGLNMMVPAHEKADPGGDGSEKKEKEASKTGDVAFPGAENGLIQVPETKEEFEQVYGKTDEDNETGEAAGGDDKTPEEKKDTTDKSGQGDGEDVKITEDSPLYLHAATLQEKGILPNLDLDEMKNLSYEEAEKYIFDKQQEYIEQGKEEYKSSLTDDQKNYLDMIEKGVPDDVARNQASIEKAYRDVTDEVLADNEELQENIIYNANRLKGLKDEKIKIIIEKAKEDESLFEEAKDSKADIDAYLADQKQKMLEDAKKREDEAAEKERELQAKVEESVNNTTQIFPDIPVSDAEKKKILEYMTKPVDYVNHNGRRIPVSRINKKRNENKIDFDIRLNYFIELGLFDKNTDLSKLMKKTKSSAAQKFSSKLRGEDTSEGIKVNKRSGEEKQKSEKITFPWEQ